MLYVLIVDDEKISQNYIRGLIPWEEEGFHLYPPVYNGEEARKILDASPVDIVLLDVFMPGENGVSLSHYIVDHYPRIAIVAVSSHDDYDYVREILKKGAYDYILKHRLNEETLRSALRGIIAAKNGQPSKPEEEARERIKAWLFDGAALPFPPENAAIGVSVAKVPLEKLPEGSRNIVIPGIITLMENDPMDNTDNSGKIKVFFREPDFFVSCIRFSPGAGKQAVDFLSLCNSRNRGRIRQIYNLEYYSRDLPLLNPAAIPSQIRRLFVSFRETGFPSRDTGISLSVSHRKILTYLLKENNIAGTELILRSIFSSMDTNEQGAKLAVVRDLGNLFRDFAEERGIPAGFEDLMEWAGQRKPEECGQKFRELFRRLMDEDARDEDSYVRQARNFMLNHYTGNLNLEKTAGALNISPSYLSRVYKKETGRSFVDALNQIRVEAAKACLLEGMNLKTTAASCGFMYYNYFIKVFRDHTGITPAEFVHNLWKS